MRRKLSQFCTDLMKTIGINIETNEDSSNIVWRFIISFGIVSLAVLSCCMVSITNINFFYKFVTPIPYTAAITINLSGIYCLYHHRKIIVEIFKEMNLNFYTYPDEEFLQIDYKWYLLEKNIYLLIIITRIISFGTYFTICIPMFGELAYYGRIRTFIVPQWIPWSIDSLQSELFVMLLQCIEGFFGICFNYATIVFLIIIITEFMRQYHRLIVAVSSLEHRSLVQVTKRECFHHMLRENIIHGIRHHQALIRNFHLFEIWFSMFFSIELAISAVTFTFALYIAVNAQSMSEILNYFTLSFFIWMNLLIRCLISEIFSHLNNKLAETLFWEAPWLTANKENRKLLLMFHSDASQPLRLFGLSIFEATRVTFGNLIRKTYSFFNVLNHLIHEESEDFKMKWKS